MPQRAAIAVLDRRLDSGSRAPLAVAYSGGGDSLALLVVACAWAAAVDRPVIALHVDHRLQAMSGAWADRAQAQADRLGARFMRLTWDAPKPTTGLPAAARAARHSLMAEAARAAGCRVLLMGHTLDDQLENAVMRAAGAPVGALSEWSPSPSWPQGRGLFLLRPLLAIRRAALREGLAAGGLAWIDDPANDDSRYARARARRALGSSSAVPPPPADIRALAAACRPTAWGGFEIDRAALAAAPVEQALRLLQIALACASGAPGLARPGRARGLLARIAAPGAFVASLAGARVEAGSSAILAREAGEAARGGLAPLMLEPGQAAVWDGRFEVVAQQSGWRVEALRGQMSRLDPADVARLRDVPVFVRPSLPVLRAPDDLVAPGRLALAGQGAHIGFIETSLSVLCEHRFAAAAGLVSREVDIGTIARMAKVLVRSYPGSEVKG
jgi:tRNA(Ile)-lysidine synthase